MGGRFPLYVSVRIVLAFVHLNQLSIRSNFQKKVAIIQKIHFSNVFRQDDFNFLFQFHSQKVVSSFNPFYFPYMYLSLIVNEHNSKNRNIKLSVFLGLQWPEITKS